MNQSESNSSVWKVEDALRRPAQAGGAKKGLANEKPALRQLVWSSSTPDGWETLVYRHGELWEACFFRWAIHHEHIISSSLKHVRKRAEQRIRALEQDRLKGATWRVH